MKKKSMKVIAWAMLFVVILGFAAPVARAEEVTDPAVLSVIEQLEAIDTLQQMQDERKAYAVNSRYGKFTTDTKIITAHETARVQYETYVANMFAARAAAKNAYDALTEEQKAQIDPALVEKLNDQLDTNFRSGTFPVTQGTGVYTFEAVKNIVAGGMAYETTHMVTEGSEIPSTFILVDTSDGKTEWTPDGIYECTKSNYEVVYCCDVMTPLVYTTHYKRTNLEDSGYYSDTSARHIRAILQNAYPFVSLEQMKSNLKEAGLQEEFVDQLTRSDVIAAVQMAIWAYANASEEDVLANMNYSATYDVIANRTNYMNPLHDYTNELWTWWTTNSRQFSYDPRMEYRVNTLVYYLCNLEGVDPAEDQIVISNVEVTRAELMPGENDTYRLGMYVHLNNGGREEDDLKVVVTSYSVQEDGTKIITAQSNQVVAGRKKMEMHVTANPGDLIQVVVEGTQTLSRGVYFYEPEGGREVSQSLVGVSQGKTAVRAEKDFVFVEDSGEMGLRIHKTESGTGLPLSDIRFQIYGVSTEDGEELSTVPTAEEIAKYMTEENLVGTVITDVTGYASITLPQGTYLVAEVYNADKTKAPIDPFYVTIPMTETMENEDGTTSVNVVNIVSVYPKNEPVIPEEPPIIPPTPDRVTGKFEILKYDVADRTKLLKGAQFEVYRIATAEDAATKTIVCDGVEHIVAAVMADQEALVLTTDENGRVVSPELSCGTYFLVEVRAPAGYNLLDQAVAVTVVSNEITPVTAVEIPNQRGSILPETGAEGTKWFILIGSTVCVVAVVLLIVKKRMSVYEM